MRPITHLILGIALALVIFLVYPSIGIISLTIIVLSSVLIDIDHYIYYIFKKKKINPIIAYRWYVCNRKKCCSMTKEQKEKVHLGTCFLHGIEILIILSILGNFVSPIFYFILIGFTFHLVSDLVGELIRYEGFKGISVIYTFLKSRGLTFIDDLEDF